MRAENRISTEGGRGSGSGLYRALGEVGQQGGGSCCLFPLFPPPLPHCNSWPQCTSLLAFSDLGPKGHRGGRALQMGQKVMFKKKMKLAPELALLQCTSPWEDLC